MLFAGTVYTFGNIFLETLSTLCEPSIGPNWLFVDLNKGRPSVFIINSIDCEFGSLKFLN